MRKTGRRLKLFCRPCLSLWERWLSEAKTERENGGASNTLSVTCGDSSPGVRATYPLSRLRRQLSRRESQGAFPAGEYEKSNIRKVNAVKPKRLTLFAGHYGSGKTNIALNYACFLHAQGLPVTIADLDIVNPYFRTKDSEAQLASEGIGLICSPFANSNLDVPAMPKETYALIDSRTQYGVLDIGGDDRGALALGRYTPEIREENDYEMLLVVNRSRPLTRTPADTVAVMREIEAACGLPFTGIVNNTNLGQQTEAEDVLASVSYAEAISRQTDLPVFMTCCAECLYPSLKGRIGNLFPLHLQKLYYQLTQEASNGETNISGRTL